MLLKILLFNLFALACEGKILKFWHVTDFHYDWLYDENGDVNNDCHRFNDDNNATHKDIGKYGNYMCDSPKTLIRTSINEMKSIYPDPDFIVWTGDSIPHIADSKYNTSDVISDMNFITKTFNESFNELILPVHGNHDYWPANQQPDSSNPIYLNAFNSWKHWIGTQFQTEMETYGYYKKSINFGNRIHHFLCLNTNLYYTSDKTDFKNPNDPGKQLKFMKDHFNAVDHNDITHIIAHIYPGAFERNVSFVWLKSKYNSAFNQIVLDNAHKIGFQIYGHGHTDSFKIYKDSDGEVKSLALLAPAVTPWYSSLKGAGSNNPGLRLMYLDSETGLITDYKQYWLNLTRANKSGMPKFEELYQFSQLYNTGDPLTPSTLSSVLNKLKSNDTLFQEYYRFNSVNYDLKKCENDCKKNQLCAIEYIDIDDLNRCLNGAFYLHYHFLLPVIYSLIRFL